MPDLTADLTLTLHVTLSGRYAPGDAYEGQAPHVTHVRVDNARLEGEAKVDLMKERLSVRYGYDHPESVESKILRALGTRADEALLENTDQDQ